MTFLKDESTRTKRQDELLNVISSWINATFSDQERMGRTNNGMKQVLFHGFIDIENSYSELDNIPPNDKLELEVLQGYLGLAGIISSLRACEYYFRRYPFKGLPVSRADHLRNIIEMVCDRIAQFRDRLKKTLNDVDRLCCKQTIPVGKILKLFDGRFNSFIRMRNQVHHRERYDGLDVSQLSLVETLSYSATSEIPSMLNSHLLYRRATAEWIKKVKSAARLLEDFMELTASFVLRHCEFVQQHRPVKA